MPSGGYRPGAGRPRKHEKKSRTDVRKAPLQEPMGTELPLEHMLRIMRDPNADPELRARMAIAAAPYVHPKVGETGKKEQKNEAAKKLASRFAASAPPLRRH